MKSVFRRVLVALAFAVLAVGGGATANFVMHPQPASQPPPITIVHTAAALKFDLTAMHRHTSAKATAMDPTGVLVYICQAQPCVNNLELAVFDSSGAPIWTVGEFGGTATWGDCARVAIQVFVTAGQVTQCYTDPVSYDNAKGLSTSCSPQQIWIDGFPPYFWICDSTSTWVAWSPIFAFPQHPAAKPILPRR